MLMNESNTIKMSGVLNPSTDLHKISVGIFLVGNNKPILKHIEMQRISNSSINFEKEK